jgi:hypothetical protein
MRDTIKQLIQGEYLRSHNVLTLAVMYPEWQMKLLEPDSPDFIEKISKTILAGFFPNLVSIQGTRGTYRTVRDGSGEVSGKGFSSSVAPTKPSSLSTRIGSPAFRTDRST